MKFAFRKLFRRLFRKRIVEIDEVAGRVLDSREKSQSVQKCSGICFQVRDNSSTDTELMQSKPVSPSESVSISAELSEEEKQQFSRETTPDTDPSVAICSADTGNAVSDDEIAPTELLSLTECVQVLVDLLRANGNYCEEVFHRILRKRYPDKFSQSTQFEKAKTQLIQSGLLTKTISGYYPIHLVAANSLNPTVLDNTLTCLNISIWSDRLR